MNAATKGAEQLEEDIKNAMSESDFKKVTEICKKAADVTFEMCKVRQREKFEKLRVKAVNKEEREELNLRPSWLINLSKKELTETEETILSKGLNFAGTQKINKVDFLAPIEGALQLSNAPQEEQEIARVKICDALSRAAKPRANFTREEWKAYSDLRKDQRIRILQADKGNATVLVDKEEYDRKVLSNGFTFDRLYSGIGS